MGQGVVFKDKEKFEELMRLLDNPQNSRAGIARHFNCNTSTVTYWDERRKEGRAVYVGNGHMAQVEFPRREKENFEYKTFNPRVSSTKFLPLQDKLLGERINAGRNYLDYVKEEEKREGRKIKVPVDRRHIYDMGGCMTFNGFN